MRFIVLTCWCAAILFMSPGVSAAGLDEPERQSDLYLYEGLFEERPLAGLHTFDGWTLNTGDDTEWADLEYSDDDWTQIDIRMGPGELPENWEGIGWFRNTVQVDSSMFGKEIGIGGRIRGAMEIYLNGRLVGRAGTPGLVREEEEGVGFVEPIRIQLDEQQDQHLAIRYSNHNFRKNWDRGQVGLSIHIGHPEAVVREYRSQRSDWENNTRGYHLIVGFMISLALLHLILFVFYPAERANLTYGLLLAAMIGGSYAFAALPFEYSSGDYLNYLIGEGVSMVLFSIINIFFVYQVIRKTVDWVPWLFLLVGVFIIAGVVYNPFTFRMVWAVFFLGSLVTAIGYFLYTRVVRRRSELDIILAAYTIALILVVPRLLFIPFGIQILWWDSLFILRLTIITIPFGYSVYLARGVAAINRRLKEKLDENERLISEKLEAEREKQKLAERQKQKLEKEVEVRTSELRESLEELKAAQQQLIQQEKLASLGQLTAGIAHEIKNPLNFVNNFSDVSLELVEEVEEEVRNAGAEVQKGEIPAILADIKANLKKIYEHGSRADGIVKSMLQHSRGGSGEREPTDLNELVREYVNLSFHGMRAGKNPINVDIELNLDEQMGEVAVIAEDFSRVILNLCNNAFDAMRQKQASEAGTQNNPNYTPKLTVRTRRKDNQAVIEIEDNGPGIPEELREKILQPFFTTKQGTEGTGLGLSITNDIVKAHGGEFEVQSSQKKGTRFIIKLES